MRDGATAATGAFPRRAMVSTRKPSATQPRMGTSAMYRMLSQWMKPERKVIALPAEYGANGRRTSIVAAMASVPPAK